MQPALHGAAQKAGEAISGAMAGDKKAAEMEHDIRVPTSSTHFTSDFGVKNPTYDNWLSASTGDRQGPALLEDKFGREKVQLPIIPQLMIAYAA